VNIAKSFGAVIIQRECNPATARNAGVTASAGRYILFLDSDQILSTNVIKECVKRSVADNAGMVRIPEVFIGKSFWSHCSAVWKNSYEKVERAHWHRRNIARGEPRFFAKEQIVRAGMLDDRLLWGEDYDLYERMIKLKIKEAECESELYHSEPASIGRILFKLFRYGKSLQNFRQDSERRLFILLLNHSLLTLTMVIKDQTKSPATVMGCMILLFLKTYYLTTGLLVSLANVSSKE
jgi:glycosyltransferase involved in cell wall biosynthesis